MKIVIFGHKRHGKDTACEYLEANFGLTFASSSFFACEKFLFDRLKHEFGYKTVQECFNDRENHRSRWYDEIRKYNSEDRTRLGREILASHDIYCGIRDLDEFKSLKLSGLIDLSIWIDASERLEPEDSSSMNLRKSDADIIIENNSSLAEFDTKINRLFTYINTSLI